MNQEPQNLNPEIVISNINRAVFKMFEASGEELAAIALDSMGLVTNGTTINGKTAAYYSRSFSIKRENLKESTKLGCLMVKHKIITQNQLDEALSFQKKHPEHKIGNILLKFKFCTISEIEQFLFTQIQIRNDIREVDTLMDKIEAIKRQLIKPSHQE